MNGQDVLVIWQTELFGCAFQLFCESQWIASSRRCSHLALRSMVNAHASLACSMSPGCAQGSSDAHVEGCWQLVTCKREALELPSNENRDGGKGTCSFAVPWDACNFTLNPAEDVAVDRQGGDGSIAFLPQHRQATSDHCMRNLNDPSAVPWQPSVQHMLAMWHPNSTL